eukprot:gnl/Trimastix_PCT/3178.p1 GENE.gnl/Trimastix_PCT/3178~~gnl/Trimastix_PCT/3178.p1  ORF type:complete len:365 (+),score=33.53 gnl/Trimastix_PCT/3178:47-1141(+)
MQQHVVLATAGYDRTIRLWEPNCSRCIRTLQHPESQVNRLVITSDQHYLAAAGNPRIAFYDIASTVLHAVSNYEGHTSNVTDVGLLKAFRWLYSSSEDGTVKVWDIRERGAKRSFSAPSVDPCLCVCQYPGTQGDLIAGYASGAIRIWDLSTSRCRWEDTPCPGHAIQSVCAPEGAPGLLAATSRGQCLRYALGAAPPSPEDPARTLADPVLESQFTAHDMYILRAIYSPTFRHIATASADHTAKIWNTEDNTLDRTLRSHTMWVWDCAFNPDGTLLATASADRKAILWDLTTGRALQTYQGHTKPIVSLALSDRSFPVPPTAPAQPAAQQPVQRRRGVGGGSAGQMMHGVHRPYPPPRTGKPR